MSATTISHAVVIIGGGNAGISLAARLRRVGMTDIGIIEPGESHYYQPLWTLVGGGCAPAEESKRTEASVMPRAWVGSKIEHGRSTPTPKPAVKLQAAINALRGQVEE